MAGTAPSIDDLDEADAARAVSAVEDPRLTDSEGIGRDDFWTVLVKVRLLAAALLPLALAIFPVFGPNRFVVAIAAGAIGSGTNLLLLQRVSSGRPIRAHLAASDLLAALVVIAAAPAAYAAGVILLVSMAALYVFWFGGRFASRMLVPTGVALLALGLWRQPDDWLPTWIAWLTTSTLGIVPISRMAAVTNSLRQRYDDMVNGIDAMVWEAPGANREPSFVSTRVTDLLGLDAADLRSSGFLFDRVDPEDRGTVERAHQRASEGHDTEAHYRLVDSSGRRRMVHERIKVSTDAGGAILHRRGILVDETARWEAESSLRAYADLIEQIPIALAIARLDDPADPSSLRIVVGNPAAGTLVDRTAGEVVGRRLVDLVPLADSFLEGLADVIRNGVTLERPTVRVEALDAVFSLRAVALGDQCLGMMLEDVTDLARRSESLKHQATHDHLTGLPNRARFNDRLDRALERASNDGRATALLMVDLDDFKEVNDSLGHEFGDHLLVGLAERLSQEMRYCDTIARLGGDEFAVLLTDADEASAIGAANRLLELCEEPFDIEGFRLTIGASIGIALAPMHASDAATLMRRADRAMYRAKEAGGGVVTYCDSIDDEGVSRIALLEDLRSAVASDAVVVHYQPRIDLRSGRILGVEALVRWRHPQRGLLAPDEFLDLAEVSGEIDALTRAVTERATRELSGLAVGESLALNVNLSGRNLREPSLAEWVAEVLAATGFDPSLLCFEVNEVHLTDETDRATAALGRLGDLGVRLGVDNFGSGHTSVSQLRRLPIDELKIDRHFIGALDSDRAVVRSVIDLGHNLGLHVAAEGVEDLVTLDTLRVLGCDSAQGYHLAAPMPIDALEHHLRSRGPLISADLGLLGRTPGSQRHRLGGSG